MNKFIEYAPFIIVVVVFILQQKIVITPEQLEKKHREILEDIEKKFVSMPAYLGFRDQVLSEFERVNKGINDIKDFLMNS
ncbi:MAG: hypothetical protein E7Z91_01385 [Cyanobacteria bacterium SIG30]|nr:hypothetical protein [Cyanobacteria bacterium SIG30]